jgi:hypothetical protein
VHRGPGPPGERQGARVGVGDPPCGQFLICRVVAVEPCLNAPIAGAMPVVSDTDSARVDRPQAPLTGPRCGEVRDC